MCERLVDLCCCVEMTEGAASEVFGYIEQAKSRSLRDLFSNACRSQWRPLAAAGWSDRFELREELNWHYHHVEIEELGRDEGSAGALDTLQARLRRREGSSSTCCARCRQISVRRRDFTGPRRQPEEIRYR